MKVSDRLTMVASFVNEGSNIADIGTDHGYVPILLAESGKIGHGLAMDVRTGPLGRAQEHIRQHKLERVIETRLSDGVEKLEPGEADTVIIAGMGGELVIHILEEGERLWDQVEHWILSPQSELDKVRRFLRLHGFSIAREEMLKEDGKYYTVMDVTRGSMGPLAPWEELYGPCLIRNRHPILREFLEKERTLLERILDGISVQKGESARRRAEELKEQLEWIRAAESRITENQGTENQAAENRVTENQAAENRTAENQAAENRTVENQEEEKRKEEPKDDL